MNEYNLLFYKSENFKYKKALKIDQNNKVDIKNSIF